MRFYTGRYLKYIFGMIIMVYKNDYLLMKNLAEI
jgi:hypothetical protein